MFDYDRSGVYYKIFLNKHGLITIVCMQDFDELDYNKDRFYRAYNENTDSYEVVGFDSERDAIAYLNRVFKPEYIDDEYVRLGVDTENPYFSPKMFREV